MYCNNIIANFVQCIDIQSSILHLPNTYC